MRRLSLVDRLAPYLRDAVPPSRLLAAQRAGASFPVLGQLLGPVVGDVARLLDRWLGGAHSVRRRLEQSGRRTSLEEFRAEQVLWGALGLVGGGALSALVLANRPEASPLALLVLCVVGGLTGVLLRDRWLTREVARREDRMLAELPTVAELLALSVAAGEGPVGALERVVRTGQGALAEELQRALADARAGEPLTRALQALAARTTVPALERFVDGVVIAVERGTPLADVLRAQAVDVRAAHQRSLLEAGGRKEIAMMVPVVFLVLPVSVLFALFPGFYGLSFSTP
jgi:tight adherence protein C